MYRYFFISLFVLMSIISKAEVTLQSTLLSNSEWEIIYPIDDSIVHRWKFSSSEIGVSAFICWNVQKTVRFVPLSMKNAKYK